jgi:hypothetical protein
MTLCRKCSMSVKVLSPACPRCGDGWPGLTRSELRRRAPGMLWAISMVALIALAWVAAVAMQ